MSGIGPCGSRTIPTSRRGPRWLSVRFRQARATAGLVQLAAGLALCHVEVGAARLQGRSPGSRTSIWPRGWLVLTTLPRPA